MARTPRADARPAALLRNDPDAEISIDRVARELARIGFSDIRKLFLPDGNLRDIAAIDDDLAAAICSIKIVTRGRPAGGAAGAEVAYVAEVKLWDKAGALEKLGRHLGMFNERLQLTVDEGAAALLEAARRRASAG